MVRRLFSFAVAVSRLFTALSLAAWSRSERTMDSFIVRTHIVVTQPRIGQLQFPSTIRPAVWELDSRQGQLQILHAGPLFNRQDNELWWRRSADRHVAWPLPDARADQTWRTFQVNLISSTAQFAGFILATGAGPGYEYAPITKFTFPCWSLVVLCALLPAIWSWKQLRRLTRYREGLCEMCGYDLRATPDCCPECGHVPTKVRTPKPFVTVPDLNEKSAL
jgi:hypothetical protein